MHHKEKSQAGLFIVITAQTSFTFQKEPLDCATVAGDVRQRNLPEDSAPTDKNNY